MKKFLRIIQKTYYSWLDGRKAYIQFIQSNFLGG